MLKNTTCLVYFQKSTIIHVRMQKLGRSSTVKKLNLALPIFKIKDISTYINLVRNSWKNIDSHSRNTKQIIYFPANEIKSSEGNRGVNSY